MPERGLTLAVFWLAEALGEIGHDTLVLFGSGEVPTDAAYLILRASGLGFEASNVLRVGDVDVSADLVEASASAAPTLFHTQVHSGVCADHARYWNHLQRPCAVPARRHCMALRPLLGCSGRSRAFDPRQVSAQRRLLAVFASRNAGVVSISTDQPELYLGAAGR